MLIPTAGQRHAELPSGNRGTEQSGVGCPAQTWRDGEKECHVLVSRGIPGRACPILKSVFVKILLMMIREGAAAVAVHWDPGPSLTLMQTAG